MLTFVLAAMLTAAPQAKADKTKSQPAAVPGDLRAFCTGDSRINEKDAGAGGGSSIVSFVSQKNRIVRLKSGQTLMANSEGGEERLLLDEDGRYRVLVSGKAKISMLSQSLNYKHVAVVIVHEEGYDLFRVPTAEVYIFDTESFTGKQAFKRIGFSGIGWSPDSSYLAVADYSKVRLFDLAKGEVVESCGVDSRVTADGHERMQQLRWVGPKELAMTYQNPSGTWQYVVTVP